MISLIFPFHFFLPAWTHKDATIDLEPNKSVFIENNFFMGGIVKVMVLNFGGANNSVETYFEISNLEIVSGPIVVEERYTFEFQTEATGLHNLVILNNASLTSHIYFIVWQYYYNVLLLTIGAGLFISGIIFIVIERTPDASQLTGKIKSYLSI